MQELGALRARLLLEAQNFKKGMSDARDELKTTGFSAKQLNKDFSTVQKASGIMGAAIVAGIGASVKTAADFEQQMSRVKAISGATGEGFERLKKSAMDLGASTSKSASEVAKGMEDMAAMGFDVNEIIGAMPGVISAAEAAGSDLATTAGIVAAALNGFQLEATDASKVADVLAMTANVSAASVEDMGYAFKYAAPIANTLGISMEELAAATGIMVDSGLEGSQAGTTLRMALQRLADPTKEGAAALKELGVKTTDAKGNFLDLTDILPQFVDGLDDMTDAQKVARLSTIFGTEAASGMLAVIAEGPEKFDEFTKSLEDSAGISKKTADVMKDNLKGSFEEFQGALETVGIQLGDEFLPLFTDIVKKGTDVVNAISEVDTGTIKAGLAFAGTTAAIALTASTIGKLVLAVRTLSLSMGPAGWLITGISLLGGLIAGVNTATAQANDITLESIEAKNKEIQTLDVSIQRYDQLKAKLTLSNDELGRFLDINSEISSTTDPNIIAKLKDEQEKLQKQSGLTNDEMNEFLGLNKDIAGKIPETNRTITEQGNAFINSTDAAKKYNKEQRELIELQLKAKLAAAEADRSGLLQKERDLLKDINNLEADRKTASEKVEAQKQVIFDLEQKQQMFRERGDEINAANIGNQITGEKNKLATLQDQVAEVYNEIVAKQENLNKTREQLKEEENVKQKLIDITMQQTGLNAKKGEELLAIDQEIAKLENSKKKLEETTPVQVRNTDEYKAQVKKIQEQIDNLDTTKSKIVEIIGSEEKVNQILVDNLLKQEGINAKKGQELSAIDSQIKKLQTAKKKLDDNYAAGKLSTSEYQSQVSAIQSQITKLETTKSKVEEIIGSSRILNTVLGETVIKTVRINIQGQDYDAISNGHSVMIPGVNYHTGGITGRGQMPMLHTGGLAAKFANAPLHNEIDVRLLRNEMVLTEAQQANLMRMIDAGFTSNNQSDRSEEKPNLTINQSNTFTSYPLTPSETARKNRRMLEKLANQYNVGV